MNEVSIATTPTTTRSLVDACSPSAEAMIDAVRIREPFGFLTIPEVAERYDIPVQTVGRAVELAQVGSVTFECGDGTTATFLPTRDGAVAEWLESTR